MKSALALGVTVGFVVCLALVFAALKLTVWSGLSVVIYSEGAAAKVESKFLGDYELGITRLRITHGRSQASIVDINDPAARIPNVFVLQTGANEIALGSGPPAHFALLAGEPYRLTLCGNNGFARQRCTSRSLQLTVQ